MFFWTSLPYLQYEVEYLYSSSEVMIDRVCSSPTGLSMYQKRGFMWLMQSRAAVTNFSASSNFLGLEVMALEYSVQGGLAQTRSTYPGLRVFISVFEYVTIS